MSSSIRPSRGRIAPAPARPTNASSVAGSRPKTAVSSTTASTTSVAPTPAQSNNAPRTKVTKATTTQAPARTRVEPPSNRVRATTTPKGTLPGASSSTSSRPPSTASKEHTRPQAKIVSSSGPPEALQVAAQSSAWKYMTSTLELEFMKSKNGARATLDTRRKELAEEEAGIAESRVRFEAERLVDFYDELGDRQAAEEIAALIRRFKNFERTTSEATASALQLTSLPLDETTHISQYNTMLEHIDSLEGECQQLDAQIIRLASDVPQGGKIHTLLGDLSNILLGHTDNIACAMDVVRCCKENYQMGVETLTLI